MKGIIIFYEKEIKLEGLGSIINDIIIDHDIGKLVMNFKMAH